MPNAIRVPSLRLTELDGSPDIQGVERIYLTNGYMSSLGSGSVLLSMSGAGDSTYTSAYASRPAASSDGNLFLPNNGFVIERDTGSVWSPWGPLFQFTAPVDSDFSNLNMTGASISTTNGQVFLSIPAGASIGAAGFRGRVKARPTLPYVITAAFLVNFAPANSIDTMGLTFYDGTQLATFGVGYSTTITGGYYLLSAKWNSVTSFSVNYLSGSYSQFGPVVWLRIADDNSNRICSISADGINFVAFQTVGRTDFLTATQVGWGGSSSNNIAAGLTLLSWKET